MAKALKSATKVVNSAEQKVEEKVTPTEQDSVVAVATDNVPEGEPTENEDGSVNVYNENNEKVGTMSADEVKKAEESVSDIQIEIPEGHVCAIVVPGTCRILGIAGRHEDFSIPGSCIKRIGPDIVLVDTKPNDCRVPRKKLF